MMNKKLVILGAGESGIGAAFLGIKKGYKVFLSDIKIPDFYLAMTLFKDSFMN